MGERSCEEEEVKDESFILPESNLDRSAAQATAALEITLMKVLS